MDNLPIRDEDTDTMTHSRKKLMQYFTELYRENLDAIRNGCGAPEPLPEHREAIEAILRERAAADGDDVERIMRALEQGRRATRRPMPGSKG